MDPFKYDNILCGVTPILTIVICFADNISFFIIKRLDRVKRQTPLKIYDYLVTMKTTLYKMCWLYTLLKMFAFIDVIHEVKASYILMLNLLRKNS